MYKRICHRILATIVIAIALTLAVIVSIRQQHALTFIMYITRFFDVMLPVLAVGALIKYLISCNCPRQDQDSCKNH